MTEAVADRLPHEAFTDAMAELGYGYGLLSSEGRIVFASDAFCRLTGYSRDELLVLPHFSALNPPGVQAGVISRTAESFENTEIRTPMETVLVARDGRLVDVEGSGRPVTVEGETRLLVLFRDVTGRRQAERRERAQLARTQAADDERRRLLARLAEAAETERRGRAANAQDDSIQVMAAVLLRIGIIRRQTEDPSIDDSLTRLEETVQAGIGRLRQLP